MFWMLAGHSLAISCVHDVLTEATGVGAAGRDTSGRFREALSEALASAIAKTSGLYIDKQVLLRESSEITNVNGEKNVNRKQDFERNLNERLAGTVLDYSILQDNITAKGLERVTVKARVCLDKRIALSLRGNPALVRSLQGLLEDSVKQVGWDVVEVPPTSASPGTEGVLDIALNAGATLVGTGNITATGTPTGRFRKAVVGINASFVDARTLEVAASVNVTSRGIGFTQKEANADALKEIAQKVSKALTVRLLAAKDRKKGVLRIQDVKRSNIRFTLAQLLENIPGVVSVTDTAFDGAAHEIRLTLETSADLCTIASALADQRRVLLRLGSCDSSGADLFVIEP
jgi:hypothetical protein